VASPSRSVDGSGPVRILHAVERLHPNRCGFTERTDSYITGPRGSAASRIAIPSSMMRYGCSVHSLPTTGCSVQTVVCSQWWEGRLQWIGSRTNGGRVAPSRFRPSRYESIPADFAGSRTAGVAWPWWGEPVGAKSRDFGSGPPASPWPLAARIASDPANMALTEARSRAVSETLIGPQEEARQSGGGHLWSARQASRGRAYGRRAARTARLPPTCRQRVARALGGSCV
jgi:hypothetical protein